MKKLIMILVAMALLLVSCEKPKEESGPHREADSVYSDKY
jgi:PBP1b-binding outer membrane lipoprotein LpoB